MGSAAVYTTNSFHVFYTCQVKVNIAFESEQRYYSHSKFLLQQEKIIIMLNKCIPILKITYARAYVLLFCEQFEKFYLWKLPGFIGYGPPTYV